MTPAEQLLWKLLRNRRLRGWKFRRQKAIGFYIADFYCHELKLIVELDGDVHSTPRQCAHDENRDFDLNFLGIEVLRIPNRQLYEDPGSVLDRIVHLSEGKIASATSPLSPAGEGDRGCIVHLSEGKIASATSPLSPAGEGDRG